MTIFRLSLLLLAISASHADHYSLTSNGRVEVTHNGQVGSICDDFFDHDAATVLCRQLGLGTTGEAFTAGGGPQQIWLDDVRCSGTESSLEECSHNPWGLHNCGTAESVGVRCFTGDDATFELVEGDRVQVTAGGQVGSVCDDDFDNNAATVLCRQLGLGTIGQAFTAGGGPDLILLDDVRCSGTESSLGECEHRPWGQHNCGTAESVGVRCSYPPTTFELVEGGRIQVTHQGQVGSVCDDLFDNNAATVLCRQLGLGRRGQSFTAGGGPRQIWLDDVRCSGTESSLDECEHNPWGQHNCGTAESVGVRCMGRSRPVFELIGDQHNAGILQVTFDGRTGVVCDDMFQTNEASMVCRMMGRGSSGTATTLPRSEAREADILLDDVSCPQNARTLRECSHRPWGEHNCNSMDETVYVTCDGPPDTDTETETETDTETETEEEEGPVFSLEGGGSSGRLLITWNGQVGSVCDDGFGNVEASVACRELGLSDSGTARTAPVGDYNEPILLDDVSCTGRESSLSDCRHSRFSSHNCDLRTESVVVNCGSSTGSFELGEDGLVLATFEGAVGTVCDDFFGNSAATVLCRSLGLGYGGEAFTVGGGPPIILDDVSCSGFEDNLNECPHLPVGEHNCSPETESVGVRCFATAAEAGVGQQELMISAVLLGCVVLTVVGVFVVRRRRSASLASQDEVALEDPQQ